ncbi:MAG: winged helix-turn-helix transcriptional regulator [Rhodobacteraceae bacterium]|jgi:ArsR family transcriptional regulator|nr:winged helix-turn-helix transcriptional regulator [Paracoccaceae bacterium]
MTHPDPESFAELESRAEEVAALLKHLANARRLLILCRLAAGPATVTELCTIAGLSQSALSQHLARMRAESLVQGKKDGLQIYYSITNPRCLEILTHLRSSYCDPMPHGEVS